MVLLALENSHPVAAVAVKASVLRHDHLLGAELSPCHRVLHEVNLEAAGRGSGVSVEAEMVA